MIKSFRHEGLKTFFESGRSNGIPPSHQQKIRSRLTALHTAVTIEDMELPGFRLQRLQGDKQGMWSVDVHENWRIIFGFVGGNVYVINYEHLLS
jgi:toxin HigB-1